MALNEVSPVDAELAADGVAEVLGVFAGETPEWGTFTAGDTSIRLSATDASGTWTYRLTFTDQIPPDGQGARNITASGPVTYVGGSTAILHVFSHVVFDKGGVEKLPPRDTASCGGSA